MSGVRRFAPDAAGAYGWRGVDRLHYKDEGSAPFRDITRQVLFTPADQDSELRYFEIAPGGYSTLERHAHTHAVLILRGRGTVQLGDEIHAIQAYDLVTVDPMTWHQFRAAADSALGFLCLVNKQRDQPQLPSVEEAARLKR